MLCQFANWLRGVALLLSHAILNKSTKRDQMESINRSDFAALEVIEMILRVTRTDLATCGETVEGLKWALDMIQHEVEQTGRACMTVA